MPNLDTLLSKGSNALTVAGGFAGKVSGLADKFNKHKGQPAPEVKPPRKTEIQPLNAFIAQIKKDGLARQNSYTFTFSSPYDVNLREGGSGTENWKLIPNERMLELLCSSCSLPGVNIGSAQQRTFGELYEMPNDKMYGALNSTFYVDNHFMVKKLFDQWQELIMDKTSRTFSFYNDYTTNISVKVFDKWGMPHYEMVMYNAWPKSMNDITLANDSSEFMKLDITWAYRKFETFTIENDLHTLHPQPEGQRSVSARDRLMGYVGGFKDYQNKFRNVRGDISRSKNLIRKSDWGGLVGQSFTGAKDFF